MATVLPFMPRRAARINRQVRTHLLTRRALAAELGVSTRTIFRYQKRGMPVTRRAFVNLFDPALVAPWIEANSFVGLPRDWIDARTRARLKPEDEAPPGAA